jgi:ELWxxDGT repeat protein
MLKRTSAVLLMSMLFAGSLISAPSALAAENTPVLVKDIDTRTLDAFDPEDDYYFAELGGFLYFNNESNLWKTDGTEAGTEIVKSFSSLQDIIAFEGKLYLEADDGKGEGSQLWVSNGTAAGTSLFKVIRPGGSSSSISRFTVVGDTLFFRANNGVDGSEIWKTDGTETGTVQVADINASGNSSPYNLTAVGNTLFFTANNGTNGEELWKGDGTETGTVLVKDIRSGSQSSSGTNFTAVGSTLFFSANTGNKHTKLALPLVPYPLQVVKSNRRVKHGVN